MFSRASGWLKGALARAAGVSVTYTRGATSLSVVAWVGRTVFSQLPSGQTGAAIVFGDRDYLIPVASLTLTGPGTPDRGDRIVEMIEGVSTTFEVVAPGGEPPWRYSDPARTLYRLHTKRVTP